MKLNCTTEKYGELYARWLDKPGALLDYARATRKDIVLDLCGGTGAVALAAQARGCTTALLDLNPRCKAPYLVTHRGAAEDAAEVFSEGTFTLVVCRQAINYCNLLLTAAAVWKILDEDGRFVFNTFRQPRWALKVYRHSGRSFLEASGYLGRTVLHLQASPLLGLDVSKFAWYPHETIMRVLKLWFDIEYQFNGSSARYFCRRRPDRYGALKPITERWLQAGTDFAPLLR